MAKKEKVIRTKTNPRRASFLWGVNFGVMIFILFNMYLFPIMVSKGIIHLSDMTIRWKNHKVLCGYNMVMARARFLAKQKVEFFIHKLVYKVTKYEISLGNYKVLLLVLKKYLPMIISFILVFIGLKKLKKKVNYFYLVNGFLVGIIGTFLMIQLVCIMSPVVYKIQSALGSLEFK